jgi:hypothetical protein
MQRRSRFPFLVAPAALTALWALLAPAQAVAQPTRLLEDLFGFGGPEPFARVLFHQEGEALCATLAITRGPRAKRTSEFLFRRVVEPKAKEVKGRLVFDFPKEPERVEGTVRAWVACTESPPRFKDAKRDELEFTVRNATAKNEDVKLYVEYPAAGEASGMDVLDDGSGGFAGRGFVRPL